MNSESIQIRKLITADIPVAMKLVLAEGWNQTERDWRFLIDNPVNTCLAAEVDGNLVGTATAINYFNHVAWISMVLVNKEYRGRGISKILLSSILNELKLCESIKLDATPAGQPVYKMLGFRDEYKISRMVNTSFESTMHEDLQLIPQTIQQQDIRMIIEFDQLSFGSGRTQLISSWVNDYPKKSWMLKQNNHILGFALGREGNKYHHIGPVSANTSDHAKLLIVHALKELSGQAIVIDILEDKQDLTDWLTSIDFMTQRTFMRMFLRNNPFAGDNNFQCLISGPEFG